MAQREKLHGREESSMADGAAVVFYLSEGVLFGGEGGGVDVEEAVSAA